MLLYFNSETTRNIEIETNLLQLSHGSARVRYSNGGTDVVSSVKAEVQPIDDSSVPEDRIEVSVAFTASASTDFRKRAVEVSGNVIAENLYK